MRNPIPRVVTQASRTEALKFLRQLHLGGRLGVYLASDLADRLKLVLKAVAKEVDWNRLIADARPPNADEEQVILAVKHLGLGSLWQELILEPDEVLALYSTDVRDFYHVFEVSDAGFLSGSYWRQS